jgi:hypothetical protein
VKGSGPGSGVRGPGVWGGFNAATEGNSVERPDHDGRLHLRLNDLPPVGGVVATVDAPTGQIDDNIGLVDFVRPRPEGFCVPLYDSKR